MELKARSSIHGGEANDKKEDRDCEGCKARHRFVSRRIRTETRTFMGWCAIDGGGARYGDLFAGEKAHSSIRGGERAQKNDLAMLRTVKDSF